MGTKFSDPHPQEMNTPQDSILSVILFSLKINGITHSSKSGVDCSLYVDDFQMSIIERQLHHCLKLQQCSTDFKFSKTNTGCMRICQKRRLHLDPESDFSSGGDQSYGGGGVIFHSRLSFAPHVR